MFALQQAGAIAIFQLAYRPGLASVLAVKQFHRNQIPGHISAKGSGVAIDCSAQASGDGGCPFKTSQSQAGCPLGDIIGGDAGFGVDGGKIGLCVEFQQPGPVDDNHAAHTPVADQHVRTAAQQDERQVHLPQLLCSLHQFVCLADENQHIGRAADARGGIAGERNILLHPVTKGQRAVQTDWPGSWVSFIQVLARDGH